MNGDNSSQAVLYRLRKGIGNSDQTLKNYKNNNLTTYGRPYLSSLGKIPTIIGKRNGVPIGADQDYFQQQRNIMSKKNTRQFRSNNLEDILPTIYNGNTNMLASSGGAPLAFALEDESELHERLFSEGIRGSTKNPLSAKFALDARENRGIPVFGGATDVMRRELEGGQDDNETMARKLHSGHLGTQSPFLTSESQIDPEVQAFMDQTRAPTRADFKGLNSKFQATVNKIGSTSTAHLKNLNSQLTNISNTSKNQGVQLSNIHAALNKYGKKFDALQVARQSQQAGAPQRRRVPSSPFQNVASVSPPSSPQRGSGTLSTPVIRRVNPSRKVKKVAPP